MSGTKYTKKSRKINYFYFEVDATKDKHKLSDS